MANSEDIEARLCDYIEGQLSPADRAEIERHLESHPKHRQMIQELIESRRLVGALPRSKAPADMTELLQGQLERSMLLDGGLSDSSASRQPRHVAHIVMTTAVVLLTAGFGSAVYYMLHSASGGSLFSPMAGQFTSQPISQATTQPTAPATQPIAKMDIAIAHAPPPASRVEVAVAVKPAPTTQPILEKSDAAIMASATAGPTTQPVATATATTQPVDDTDTTGDDVFDPDDSNR